MTSDSKSIKELKNNARGQLVGKYSVCIFITVSIAFIQFLILSIADRAYTGSIGSYLMRLVITSIIDLLSGVLFFGESRFFLNLVRGVEPLSIKDLVYGFKNCTDKAILVQALFTGVSLIASLPAILISVNLITLRDEDYILASIIIYAFNFLVLFIAKLFFGMSFYILNDRPDLSALEVFKESLRLMKNKKGKYFLTCLSMLPLFILGLFAFGFGALWVTAYLKTTLANFYLEAIGEEPKLAYTEKAPEKEVFTVNFQSEDMN